MVLSAIILFVVSLGYGVIVPLLPDLAGGRAATDESIYALVFAVYSGAKIISQTPGGMLVDRVGAHRILRWGLFGFFLSLVGFLIWEDMRWFVVLRFVEGVTTGLIYRAVFALCLINTPRADSGRRLGLLGGIGTSGMVVGPALGALLAPYGPRLPVFIAVCVTAAVTICYLCLPQRQASEKTPPKTNPFGQVLSFGRNLVFLVAILPVAFNKLVHSAFMGLLPLHSTDNLAAGVRGVTVLFVIAGVCFAVAQPLGGILADRLGARRLVLALIPLQLISLVALRGLTTLTTFALGFGAFVVVTSFIFTATLKLVSDRFGADDSYGSLFGVLGTLTDTMLVLGPLLFLNLYALAGTWVFWVMAAAGGPFFAAYALLGRDRLTRPRP